MPRIPMPDVIVLIPGIMGSALRRGRKDVWDVSTGAAIAALFSRGDSLKDLRLPPGAGHVDPQDGITPKRLMPDVHIVPGLWKIDGYRKISDTIQAVFEVKPGVNFLEFPYDWRLDNRLAAKRLQTEAGELLRRRRQDTNNPNAKLIIVGHSMGGLVARYYLECLEGWRDTRALLTFGTPYRGSVNALDTISNGCYKGPRHLLDLSETVRSFPSVYQLLPIYRCYSAGGGSPWVRIGETTGIPNVDPARAAAALDFHNEIRDAVDRHRQDDEYRERGYKIFPIVGVEQPTNQSGSLDGGKVKMLRQYTYADGSVHDDLGDGTVPRASATPIELEGSAQGMFAADRHASLQNADAGLTHLKGAIFGLYDPLGEYRAPGILNITLSLDIDDIYWTDEPIDVRVRPSVTGTATEAVIESVTTNAEVGRKTLLSADDEWQQVSFDPLPPDVYRITVSGGTAVDPVSDIFTSLTPPA
ncbi:MAG: hypothetical protein M9890_12170 [Thermomicrobiales bacterium]|nr:hypothetical protein [Thermomicrobiales bacterium]